MDLDTLLGGVISDPANLFVRVLRHVTDQLDSAGLSDGILEKEPDELLVIAVGNLLTRMMAAPGSADGDDSETMDRDGGSTSTRSLIDRNIVLASALGACDCWGEDGRCPICVGAGAPGWSPPDQELFTAYVRPAMSAARRRPSAAGKSRRTGRRETTNG